LKASLRSPETGNKNQGWTRESLILGARWKPGFQLAALKKATEERFQKPANDR